ncbi:MAG: DNA-processing protein DprA [Planctomycetota bacterium]|nr:DNA-processing protein DprA [Planctomycetota bacterium]
MLNVPAEHDATLLERLRLQLVPGIGPRLLQLLLEHVGEATEILAASRQQLLAVPRIGPNVADAIARATSRAEATTILDRCRANGVSLVERGTPAYSPLLSEIPDPPELLYVRGGFEEVDQVAVAIVGSRRCTRYGRRMAGLLAGGLARAGLTIVSGLARGIDGEAHRAALAAGGRTIAVLATGVNRIYPPEHAELADRVTRFGAVVTEARLDQGPLPGLFPQRNRIISGLSLGVVVIEAARRSGALHTARHAIEQGREVLAVPGPVDSLASQGCHDLLRDGATLVSCVDDVLAELGPLMTPLQVGSSPPIHVPRELSLEERERRILGLVGPDPRHLDELLRSSPLDDSTTLAVLTGLEIRRLVKRLPGSYMVRGG